MRSCSRKCYWIIGLNQASFNAHLADNLLSISCCTKSKASLGMMHNFVQQLIY